jgi:hypothetical protein
MTGREPRRCPACGEVTGPPSQRDPRALCARCRTGLREGPAPLDTAAGSFDSFTAVIDALAAELGVPRAEIVRTMIEDIERRVALDRDVLVLLRRLEREFVGRRDAGG